MHVIQYIAVKSESAEEAMHYVKNQFDEMYSESEGLGGWSDWYVIGGGRWNSNPANQYQDSYNDVVSNSDNPSKFMEVIQECIAAREQEMGRIAERLDISKFEQSVNNFSGDVSDEDRFDMNVYYVKKAAEMINGSWNSDSYFYDLDNYATTPKYLLEDIDRGNKNWYLVPVDFHF